MLVLPHANHPTPNCYGLVKESQGNGSSGFQWKNSSAEDTTRHEIGRYRLLDDVVPFVKSEELSRVSSEMVVTVDNQEDIQNCSMSQEQGSVTKFTNKGVSFIYPFSVEWLASPGIVTIPSSYTNTTLLKHRGCGVGLVNRNNACFLNATVQALTYCPPLLEASLQKKHKGRCARAAQSLYCGFCEFEEHITAQLNRAATTNTTTKSENRSHQVTNGLNGRKSSASSPFKKHLKLFSHDNEHHHNFANAREIKFYPAMVKDFLQQYKISIKRQHCAYEFFTLFLDWLKRYDLPPNLEANFKANKIPQEQLFTTYLGQLFGSIVQIRKTCQVCNTVTFRHEIVSDFVLTTIKVRDAKHAFKKYFESESFSGQNCLDCDHCSKRCPFLWEKKLLVPPNVLVLCFRRASWNGNLMAGKSSHWALQKDTKALEVPEDFDISEVMNFKPNDSNNNTPNNIKVNKSGFESLKNVYRPASAIIHMGSPISGHYINISRGLNDRWYMFDDEIVSQISDKKAEDLLKTAFLIFLQRTDSIVPTPTRDDVTILRDRQAANTLDTLRPPAKRQNEIPLDLVTGFKLSRLTVASLTPNHSDPMIDIDSDPNGFTVTNRDLDSNDAASTRADTNYSSMNSSESSMTDSSPKQDLSEPTSPTSSTGSSPTRSRRRHVIGKRLKKLFVYARVIKRRLKSASDDSPKDTTDESSSAATPSFSLTPSKLDSRFTDQTSMKECDHHGKQSSHVPTHSVTPVVSFNENMDPVVTIPVWETVSTRSVEEFHRRSLHITQLHSQVRLPISKRQIHDADYDRGKIKKKKRALSDFQPNNNNRFDFDQISANNQLRSSRYT